MVHHFFDAPDETAAEMPPQTEGVTRDGTYTMLSDASAIERFVKQAREATKAGATLAFDTETDSVQPTRAGMVGLSLAFAERAGAYIPLRSPQPERHLDWHAVKPLVQPLLEDASIPKTAHNAKFDLIVLERHGVNVAGLIDDTLISSHLVDAARMGHGLDALSEALLGHRNISIESLIGSGRNQRRFDQADLDAASDYAAEDADMALRLHRHFAPRLQAQGLQQLLAEVELPLVQVIARMEQWGIGVDAAELDRQRAGLEARLVGIREQVMQTSPREFNLDSPKAAERDPVQCTHRFAGRPWPEGGQAHQDRRQHRHGGAGKSSPPIRWWRRLCLRCSSNIGSSPNWSAPTWSA